MGLDKIIWNTPDMLKANHYNPNVVHTKELQLLKDSLDQFGWIAPVIVGRGNIIIDGFHRVQIAKEKDLIVPCLTLDLDEPEAMIATIIFNRAKGTHVAAKMSDMVKSLIDDHGKTQADIAKAIGATPQEVDLLYNSDIFEHKDIKNYEYSDSWEPLTVKANHWKNIKGLLDIAELEGFALREMHYSNGPDVIEFHKDPLTLIATYNAEPVGFAIVDIIGEVAYLRIIYILKERRRLGFGTALTKAVIYEAAQAGATRFDVRTNDPDFYGKFGLKNPTTKIIKEKTGYYEVIGDISLKRSKKKRKPPIIPYNQG